MDRMAKAFGVILWCETCGAECTGFGPHNKSIEMMDHSWGGYVLHNIDTYFYVSKRLVQDKSFHYAGIMPKE